MTQQPTEFRLNKATMLDHNSESERNQRGTEVRRMIVTGYQLVTITYFQQVEGRWVPFKRETLSVN
jgi:hypothetical protein